VSAHTPGDRAPAYVNNFGFDADQFAFSVAPGQSSVSVGVSTQKDRFRLTAVAVVVPLMFAAGYALQWALLNRALGRNILPPLLITFGLSIIVQNGLLETFSADTRRLDVGHLQSASLPLGGGTLETREARGELRLAVVGHEAADPP